MKRKKGFTLVELLVVISIIAVLLSVLMPALSKAREQARRVVCSNNTKTLLLSDILYAQECDNYHVPLYNGTITTGISPLWFLNPLFMKITAMKGAFNREKGQINNSDVYTLPQAYKCPTDRRTITNGFYVDPASKIVYGTSYAMNEMGLRYDPAKRNTWGDATHPPPTVHASKLTQVKKPSEKFFFMDGEWYAVWETAADYKQWWDKYGDNMGAYQWDTPAFRHKEGAVIGYYDGHEKYRSKKEVYFYSRAAVPDPRANDAVWLPRGLVWLDK